MTVPHPRNIAMANGFKVVADSLKDESDRGTVVLAVAWLDESLTKVIAKFLKPIDQSKENLLKAGQPLGDLGTRIILADRLRLVAPNLISSLTLCRRLRNDFAHISSELSFTTPKVQDRVNELFHLNEDLLIIMGQTLSKAGMSIGSCGPDEITAKTMLETFGAKKLFHYTCGFINSALSIIEFDMEPCKEKFCFDAEGVAPNS